METFDSAIEQQLANGIMAVRGLVKVTLGSGTYGFVRDIVPLTWDGLTYQPGGLISVSDIPAEIGFAASSFTLRLAFSSDDDLTPTVLKQIYAESYRDRPVLIYDAYKNLNTDAVIDAVLQRAGYIDRLKLKRDDSSAYLEVECFSRSIDYSRKNGRYATRQDQRRRETGDRFFDQASRTKAMRVVWGTTQKRGRKDD